jgi:chitinase
MKFPFRLLCCLLVVFVLVAAGAQTKEIIGYYPSWKWKLQRNLMSPDKIPYDKLTMINYAFFYPLPDGRLIGRDSIGDAKILRGEAGSGGFTANTSQGLTQLAHRRGVKVLLSIGGWEDSNNFPWVTADEDRRAQFAHSCLEQIRLYDFDGIDIDWEYPGYADHRGTPDDRGNFTRLLRTVRDSLADIGRVQGKKYLLTAALPANGSVLKNFEMDSVAVLLDELNIMTYDFNGPWDSLSGHNAPLYAPRDDDTVRNINASFKLYTETLKIPAEKINLGVPFYGHSYAGCNSLYASHSGTDTVHFSNQGMFYYDIVPLLGECKRIWDDRAKVPYLINKSWKTLISYDDEESVGDKARYVLEHKACGLIIWEITGDFMPDGRTPLLEVISSTFKPPVVK